HQWWRLDPCPGDLVRRRPLAGGGGPAGESQGDRGAQRRNAAARHRSSETLPPRIRAGNLAYPFHGARRDSQRDRYSFRWRGFLEKEEPLAARRRRFIFDFWNVRQGPPLKGGERIILEQSARLLFTKLMDDEVIRRLQAKRPRSRVVRIAGHEMDETLTDPPQRILLRTDTETSGKCASGHLRKAALLYPFLHALRAR